MPFLRIKRNPCDRKLVFLFLHFRKALLFAATYMVSAGAPPFIKALKSRKTAETAGFLTAIKLRHPS